MKTIHVWLLMTTLLFATITGCDEDDDNPQPTVPTEETFDFNFESDAQGWKGSFSDVAVSQADDVEFVSDHRSLPDTFQGMALYHKGNNISDDLFMFFTRQVSGLVPNTRYEARFTVETVNNFGADCLASNVYVKAGASTVEPKRIEDSLKATRYYVMNIDKGNQVNEGVNAILLGEGDVDNGLPNCDPSIYGSITLDAPDKSLTVQTDDQGNLWLFMATESTFEVAHEIYFTRFEGVLTPL